MSWAFNVSLTNGSSPDFLGLNVSPEDILNGLFNVPAATAFIRGMDGRDHAFVFPSLFFEDPQLPGLEYVRSEQATFELKRVLNDVEMGSGRDFAVLKEASSGEASFVIVDHGSEFSSVEYSDWPFGHVWVATDIGDGFKFQIVSNYRAFNHAVDVGDINNDRLVDIVVSNMGVKAGGDYLPLHSYLQQANGDFTQDIEFAKAIEGSDGFWNSGAVAVANVDSTSSPEIIQANYIKVEGNPDWGGLRVLSQNNSGIYEIAFTLPRDGLFTTMGATRVIPFDYDLDGDLDLAISFEGKYGSSSNKYSGNGIEIYQNNGEGAFSRVTDFLFSANSWSFTELQWREFQVVDFDGDGYKDIILNGWWGNEVNNGTDWSLYSQIFRNVNGGEFVQLAPSNSKGLNLIDLGRSTKYVRVMDTLSEGNAELFLMQNDGSIVTAEISPLYRDEAEVLTVGGVGTRVSGFGGDDLFEVKGQNLHIDGGSGMDTVVYTFARHQYTLTQSDSGLTVFTIVEGTDTLVNIERLQFTDVNVALDLSGDGHAAVVAKILGAVFGKDSVENKEYAGIGLYFMDSGMSYQDLAALALNAAGATSNDAIVSLMWKNVVGATATAEDKAPFIAMLEGGMKAGTLAQLAGDTEFNTNNINLVGLASTGLEYLPFSV